ncbi:MAG: response regulator [Sulfurovum sp.]|jgi:CheY-like chemotaxis protein|nr:MAG: Transcriptional regulatory protein CusR [Arcobacter lacus]
MLKDLKIIYLEDEELIKESVERTVSKFIKEFISFTNPIEALSFIENSDSKFDLIITDIQMPKMNGLDFIRELKNRDINLPVIVITAYNTKEHLKKCEELGVDEVITKPVNFLELFNKIEIICSK